MIRAGIGSWTLPWAVGFPKNPHGYPKMSPSELMDYAAVHGLHLVQLYNNINLLAMDTLELTQLKQQAGQQQIDLEIGGTGIDPLTMREFIRTAQVLGSRTIRTVIPEDPLKGGRYPTETVVEIIQDCIHDFEAAGLVLLIENHDRYSSQEYRRIIEGVNSESLGICFDSANSTGRLEHFRDSFRILRDVIFSCHYKEYRIRRIDTNLGFIIEGCCPGEGENISAEFFDLVRSIDRDIDVVLEQWVPFQGSIEETLQVEKQWAERGIQLLRMYANLANQDQKQTAL